MIERDNSQGDLDGFKKVYRIQLTRKGTEVRKDEVVDLLDIADPKGISLPAEEGDVGLGDPFAFPFVTIESVIYYRPNVIGILNDNNYPSVWAAMWARAVRMTNEFIILKLSEPLR